MILSGPARMIRIHFGEDDRWEGKPLHDAIVEEARRQDLAGATVYRGIEGYGASQHVHTTRILSLSEDLPVAVIIVDTAERIAAFLPSLDELITEGLVIMDDVEVITYAGRGAERTQGSAG
jgi:PII-like signaling protein